MLGEPEIERRFLEGGVIKTEGGEKKDIMGGGGVKDRNKK